MSAIRVSKLTIQALVAGALVAASATLSSAQKVKPAGPPITTHGETKASESAAKGQANAQAKRTDADEDKAARAADKKEDATERAAMKAARGEPHELLKGIKLSSAEKKSVDAIEDKYAKQLKDLEKQEDAAEKAGKPDASIAAKIDALRLQERADLRAALSPDQAKQFDKNAASIGSKK
jgi:hypothetical protein